jgi:invasion protein IalB
MRPADKAHKALIKARISANQAQNPRHAPAFFRDETRAGRRASASGWRGGFERNQFMTNLIVSARARTACRAFATATAILGLFAAPEVMAQQAPAQQQRPQQRPAQRPQAQPAQPAQPAQQAQPQAQPQQPAAEQPQLIFSPWVKLCNKDPDPNSKRICVTVKDGRVESGLLVVSVAVIEMDGEQRKLMRVSMPYGVALQHGTRMIIDQGQPATSPFVTCLPPVVPPGGCIADYEATTDLVNRMKKGQLLTVQAIHMNGQPMSPQLQLADFAKALDGPPTDPKVFEEQQKKLQDELQKRADEARKRLESQQQPAAPAAPAR